MLPIRFINKLNSFPLPVARGLDLYARQSTSFTISSLKSLGKAEVEKLVIKRKNDSWNFSLTGR